MLKRATAQPLNGFIRIGILNPPTVVDLSTEEAGALVEEIINARSAILDNTPQTLTARRGGSRDSFQFALIAEHDKEGKITKITQARWP